MGIWHEILPKKYRVKSPVIPPPHLCKQSKLIVDYHAQHAFVAYTLHNKTGTLAIYAYMYACIIYV